MGSRDLIEQHDDGQSGTYGDGANGAGTETDESTRTPGVGDTATTPGGNAGDASTTPPSTIPPANESAPSSSPSSGGQ